MALIALSPLFLLIALAINLDSRGPVFYRGIRIGRYGNPFRPYKFRSMVVDAEKISRIVSTPNDDPRITRVGRFIRRFNLDELPQFINVLNGEMSIVGPRPEVPQYVAMFSEEEQLILTVRPGITDWATLWIKDKGRLFAGCEDPEKVYMETVRPQKLRLQLEYVRNHSVLIDLQIMLRTLKVHLLGRFRLDV
jgi:lipopolysaccharide/colanic/teichoic acid biosynthesis glycosyltransferase